MTLEEAAPAPASAGVQDSLRGLSSPEVTREAERLLCRDAATLMDDTNAMAGSEDKSRILLGQEERR